MDILRQVFSDLTTIWSAGLVVVIIILLDFWKPRIRTLAIGVFFLTSTVLIWQNQIDWAIRTDLGIIAAIMAMIARRRGW